MANVLDHASMQIWWVVLGESVSGDVILLESAFTEFLHDSPEFIHEMGTGIFIEPVCDHNETILLKIFFP